MTYISFTNHFHTNSVSVSPTRGVNRYYSTTYINAVSNYRYGNSTPLNNTQEYEIIHINENPLWSLRPGPSISD